MIFLFVKRGCKSEEQKTMENEGIVKEDLKCILDEIEDSDTGDMRAKFSYYEQGSTDERTFAKSSSVMLDRFGFVLDPTQCSR